MDGDLTRAESRILALIEHDPGLVCSVEELVARLPEMSWSAVFLGVDRLSRRGAIRIGRRGFEYVVMAANPVVACAAL